METSSSEFSRRLREIKTTIERLAKNSTENKEWLGIYVSDFISLLQDATDDGKETTIDLDLAIEMVQVIKICNELYNSDPNYYPDLGHKISLKQDRDGNAVLYRV